MYFHYPNDSQRVSVDIAAKLRVTTLTANLLAVAGSGLDELGQFLCLEQFVNEYRDGGRVRQPMRGRKPIDFPLNDQDI